MIKRGMGAIFLALPLSAAIGAGEASANSAPPYWEGTDSAGAILAGDQCPIEVKREKLTITVPELAHNGGGCGSVVAEYEFFNPTEEDFTADLVFPMGVLPDYVYEEDFYDEGNYSITADEKDVEYAFRYTRNDLWTAGRAFDVDDGIQKLYPEENMFYADDTPVYVHNVEASVPYRPEEKRGDWVNLAVEFGASAKNTRVFSPEGCNFFTFNGKGQIVRNCTNTELSPCIFTYYAVGEDVTVGNMKVYRYRNGKKEVDEEAEISEKKNSQTTFGELSKGLCTRYGGESFEKDWRAAFVSLLEEKRIKGTCMCQFDPYSLQKDCFLRWYEYSLFVPAGETVKNTVSAPLYPTVDFGSEQELYEYVYLLSPASKWADFGGIDIEIRTPCFLSDGSLFFEKTDMGYKFSSDSLPMGELSFVLTESERVYPVYNTRPEDDGPGDALVTAIVLLCVIAAAAVTVIVVVAVRSRKRNRKREEEERRLRMGRAEEGTIDLPPKPVSSPSPPPHSSEPSDRPTDDPPKDTADK